MTTVQNTSQSFMSEENLYVTIYSFYNQAKPKEKQQFANTSSTTFRVENYIDRILEFITLFNPILLRIEFLKDGIIKCQCDLQFGKSATF